MHRELYGKHKEFVEVDMTLKKLVETGIDEAIDKAVAKAEANMKKLVEVDVYKAVAKAEVKAEKRGKSQTAKAMKAGGEAIDKIRRYTGLSRRAIMAL